jgi:hypothetical protein
VPPDRTHDVGSARTATGGACGSGEACSATDGPLMPVQHEMPPMLQMAQHAHVLAKDSTLPKQAQYVMPPLVRVAREEHVVPLTALLM